MIVPRLRASQLALTIVLLSVFSLYMTRLQISTIHLPLNLFSNPTSTTPCWHHCPNYDNRIYYYPSGVGGGLLDRMLVMKTLSNLAAYLCARLEFPSPQETLDPTHNNDQPSNPQLNWTNDFINITLLKDGSNMLLPPTLAAPGVLRLESNATNLPQHLEIVQRMVLRNQRFHWTFTDGFFTIRPPLIKGLPNPSQQPDSPLLVRFPTEEFRGGCTYISHQPPIALSNLVDNVTQSILQDKIFQSSTMVSLHIRRGDTKHECDTTLERMEEYLKCSLANASNVVVLFMSDERDENYRNGIQTILESQPGGLRFVDLDHLVAKHLSTQPQFRRNNYFLFRVLRLVTDSLNVTYSLQQHRKRLCADCEPIFLRNKIAPDIK